MASDYVYEVLGHEVDCSQPHGVLFFLSARHHQAKELVMVAERFVLSLDNFARVSRLSDVPVSYLLDKYYEHANRGDYFTFTIAELKEKYANVLQHSRQA